MWVDERRNVVGFTWEKFNCTSDSAAVNSTSAFLRIFDSSRLVGFRIMSSISVLLEDGERRVLGCRAPANRVVPDVQSSCKLRADGCEILDLEEDFRYRFAVGQRPREW